MINNTTVGGKPCRKVDEGMIAIPMILRDTLVLLRFHFFNKQTTLLNKKEQKKNFAEQFVFLKKAVYNATKWPQYVPFVNPTCQFLFLVPSLISSTHFRSTYPFNLSFQRLAADPTIHGVLFFLFRLLLRLRFPSTLQIRAILLRRNLHVFVFVVFVIIVVIIRDITLFPLGFLTPFLKNIQEIVN